MTILTTADHDAFLEHGYVVLRGLISADRIAEAVRLLDAKDADPTLAVEAQAALLDCVNEQVLGAVDELAGPDLPYNRIASGNDRPRPHEPDRDWPQPSGHLDMQSATLVPDTAFLRGFIFLTPVREHGGAFCFSPGSPRKIRMAGVADSAEAAFERAKHPDLEMMEYLAEPGDVLLFDYLLVHEGTPNVTDPQTRRVVQLNFVPGALVDGSNEPWALGHLPVIPGDKPFEEMSTIEKSCSTRYLEHRFGDNYIRPEMPDTPEAKSLLTDGWTVPGGLRAFVPVRKAGRTHLFYVTGDDPRTVRRRSSVDLVHWADDAPLRTMSDPVVSLHCDRMQGLAVSIVTEGDRSRTERLRPDGDDWTTFYVTEGRRLSRQSFVLPNQQCAAVANGSFLHAVCDDAPNVVHWLSGTEASNPDAWTATGVAHTFDENTRVLDLMNLATSDLRRSGVIGEVERSGQRETLWVETDLIDDIDEEWRPVTVDAPGDVRQIRTWERGQRYWIVTHIRDVDGDQRLFWGVVDWDEHPGEIREIRTVDAFRAALTIVGIL